jgi:diguanylate cyclase (GGDEF)-like protein
LLGFIEKQVYIKEAILFTRLSAYAAFLYYFYSRTYNEFTKKISESEKRIESMENSLHKEIKKRTFEIERSNERLLEISKTDMLTRTLNKITILNLIDKLISSKKVEIFSILMFDIDNFKAINDSLGHVTGDKCLKTLADIASSNIREVDYVGRYGGDEFIIVLPTLSENEAKFVAERFRKKVNETSNPRFTVSIGIATYPYDGQTVQDLISVADKGMYKAKSKGKNTICHA